MIVILLVKIIYFVLSYVWCINVVILIYRVGEECVITVLHKYWSVCFGYLYIVYLIYTRKILKFRKLI